MQRGRRWKGGGQVRSQEMERRRAKWQRYQAPKSQNVGAKKPTNRRKFRSSKTQNPKPKYQKVKKHTNDAKAKIFERSRSPAPMGGTYVGALSRTSVPCLVCRLAWYPVIPFPLPSNGSEQFRAFCLSLKNASGLPPCGTLFPPSSSHRHQHRAPPQPISPIINVQSQASQHRKSKS